MHGKDASERYSSLLRLSVTSCLTHVLQDDQILAQSYCFLPDLGSLLCLIVEYYDKAEETAAVIYPKAPIFIQKRL